MFPTPPNSLYILQYINKYSTKEIAQGFHHVHNGAEPRDVFHSKRTELQSPDCHISLVLRSLQYCKANPKLKIRWEQESKLSFPINWKELHLSRHGRCALFN